MRAPPSSWWFMAAYRPTFSSLVSSVKAKPPNLLAGTHLDLGDCSVFVCIMGYYSLGLAACCRLSCLSCNEVRNKLGIRFRPKSTSRHKTREVKYAEYKNTKSKVRILRRLVAHDSSSSPM